MAYQSLYRRYRPRRFSDVRGQTTVVKALRNAVREERVGHAYLFSGPRGTGKTSTARILAKALNCENLTDGEPCGVCEICEAIDAGTSYDVQELDAASNNKVEHVRDLISRVALGSPGRTKVYILDEVHMLTKEASAALLKTLEEPPEHVVFVLATTDPHKVLPTIRSRTQHYDFRLIGAEDLAEHVRWVILDAELDLPDEVVEYVIRQGGGSARDTLSALERVAAAGGIVDESGSLGDLLDAVAAADPGAALVAVAAATSAGRDPRVMGEALLARLRDVFLVRMGAPVAHLTEAELEQVNTWAGQLGDRATTRALEDLGEALLAMRQAPDPRIPLEVALVKMTSATGDSSVDALAERLAKLEATVAAGVPAAPAPFAAASAPAAAPSADSAAAPPPSAPAAPAPAETSAPAADPAPAVTGPGGPAAQARAQLAAQRADRAAKTGGSSRPPRPPASGASAPPPASPQSSGPPPAPSPADESPPDAPAATEPEPVPTPATPTAEVRALAAVPDPAPPASEPAAEPDPEPEPEPAPAAEPVATPEPAAAPEPVTEPEPAGAASSASVDVASLWSERVMPALSGLTKAMYQTADLVGVDDKHATVRVDNEHHRDNCERKRSDVEAALSGELGRPVSIVFEVRASTGGGSTSKPAAPSPGRPAAPKSDDPEEHLAGTDVHELDDAPDGPAGGIAAITEAFPGAELIEET